MNISAINAGLIIDGIAGIIAIIFLYRGLVRGFSGEIIGLVGFFVASYCAWRFTEPAVELVSRYLGQNSLDSSIVAIICGVGIFFIVELIFAIVGYILSLMVKVTQLSFTDHFFGLVIGLLKACFILLIVYAVMVSLPGLIPEHWTKDSYAMKGASYVWPHIREFLEAHGLLDFTALTK